jgi:hypothetical protein
MEAIISRIYLSSEYEEGDDVDEQKDDTDVIVAFTNGEKYIASFFAFHALGLLRKRNEEKGDFLNGKYFWSQSMVLIDDCSRQSIERVVDHLLQKGDFKAVFRKI